MIRNFIFQKLSCLKVSVKLCNLIVGISEPLDGILIGAASAIGFTLTETLGLYVPSIVQSVEL